MSTTKKYYRKGVTPKRKHNRHGLYSQQPYSMTEFKAVEKKLLAAAADPRGVTNTAFTVREVAVFLGCTPGNVYNRLAKQHSQSCKAPLVRKNGRIVTANAFVLLAKTKGHHYALGKKMDDAFKHMQSTLDYVFDKLYITA